MFPLALPKWSFAPRKQLKKQNEPFFKVEANTGKEIRLFSFDQTEGIENIVDKLESIDEVMDYAPIEVQNPIAETCFMNWENEPTEKHYIQTHSRVIGM